MILISHRGNLNGSNLETENKPDQIDKCINLGYNVEVDIRYNAFNKTLWLGHDQEQYDITWHWLYIRKQYLWIHCKDIWTFHEFVMSSDENKSTYNYFWHQNDDYALTSKNYIWAYPGKLYTNKTIIVMPEWSCDFNFNLGKKINCYGICTDYVERIK